MHRLPLIARIDHRRRVQPLRLGLCPAWPPLGGQHLAAVTPKCSQPLYLCSRLPEFFLKSLRSEAIAR